MLIKEVFFYEAYNEKESSKYFNVKFVQDNHSYSNYKTLRGLHYQLEHPQDKLVRVIRGIILDVVVDLRKSSLTFGKIFKIVLSSANNFQLFVPKGFAHGFVVMSDYAEVIYKCSDYYYPEDAKVIRYDDPDLNINWYHKMEDIIVSEKDSKGIAFKDSLVYENM